MNTRMVGFKRRFMAITATVATFGGIGGGFGFGGSGCTSNAALTNFYTAVGDGVIDTAADSAANVGSDFDAIVVVPAAGFFSDLWTSYVTTRIPEDPIYQNELLVP